MSDWAMSASEPPRGGMSPAKVEDRAPYSVTACYANPSEILKSPKLSRQQKREPLTPAPPVREVQRSAPRIEQSPEEPPGDVTLIFAGGPRGAQFIPDTEFPPGLQSLPLANWKASIAANNARRGGSS
jgi:hypothetical protein